MLDPPISLLIHEFGWLFIGPQEVENRDKARLPSRKLIDFFLLRIRKLIDISEERTRQAGFHWATEILGAPVPSIIPVLFAMETSSVLVICL
jgi:hypothetical protein